MAKIDPRKTFCSPSLLLIESDKDKIGWISLERDMTRKRTNFEMLGQVTKTGLEVGFVKIKLLLFVKKTVDSES